MIFGYRLVNKNEWLIEIKLPLYKENYQKRTVYLESLRLDEYFYILIQLVPIIVKKSLKTKIFIIVNILIKKNKSNAEYYSKTKFILKILKKVND